LILLAGSNVALMLSQRASKREIKNLQTQMAAHVKCGVITDNLLQEMSTLINKSLIAAQEQIQAQERSRQSVEEMLRIIGSLTVRTDEQQGF